MKIIQLFLIFILSISSVYGLENKVYIEQTGSSNVVTIDQIGAGNMVGGTTGTSVTVPAASKVAGPPIIPSHLATIVTGDPSSSNYALIKGDSNKLTLNHIGDSNWAQYLIYGNTNTYSNSVTGNNNIAILKIGTNTINSIDNKITEIISGNYNYISQTVTGNNVTSKYTISGIAGTNDNNQITATFASTNGSNDTLIDGSSNHLINEQLDGGPHILKQDIAGDYNSIVTQQQGSSATTVDIKVLGSFNSITVRSSDSISGIINPTTALIQ